MKGRKDTGSKSGHRPQMVPLDEKAQGSNQILRWLDLPGTHPWPIEPKRTCSSIELGVEWGAQNIHGLKRSEKAARHGTPGMVSFLDFRRDLVKSPNLVDHHAWMTVSINK